MKPQVTKERPGAGDPEFQRVAFFIRGGQAGTPQPGRVTHLILGEMGRKQVSLCSPIQTEGVSTSCVREIHSACLRFPQRGMHSSPPGVGSTENLVTKEPCSTATEACFLWRAEQVGRG